MASNEQIFKLKKLNGKGVVLAAMKHNKRTLQCELGADSHINAAKIPLNYCLHCVADTPEAIATRAKVLMVEAGIDTPRKNAVMAVEAVFSLPIDRHNQDTRPFFTDCLTWIKQNFAGVLLSFDVHLDESAPHAHALILPLIDGKMQGSDMVGSKFNLKRLQNLFYADIGQHYGLIRSDSKRLTQADKENLARQVLTRLKSDPAMKSSVWACFNDAIHSDPLPFAQSLGIVAPAKRQTKTKSFAAIMTSKGKGKSYEVKTPIGNYA